MDIYDILDAREQRVFRQKQLLRRFQKPLVCFTLNIPGPEKNPPLADIAFAIGKRRLQEALATYTTLHFEQRQTAAGWEGFWIVDGKAEDLKTLMVKIEDSDPMGRVFDMDVLLEGTKLEREVLGFSRRKCLLCQEDAVLCGRSRSHDVRELFDAAMNLIRSGISELIARLAVQSLLCEVYATPKPGLVDQCNSGSHTDMDLLTFLRSTAALWPYFRRCARVGLENTQPEAVFPLLRKAGLDAEKAMLNATGGVNTHKGAIFTMGILCGAAGMLHPDRWQDPEALSAQCAAISRGVVQRDFANLEQPRTVGEKLFVQFGITGARGQAEAGFPAALKIGLPVLEEGLARGKSLNEALCAALLHILAATQDTNLIKRGGRIAQMQLQVALKTMLDVQPFPDREILESLDQMFIRRGLSPGGSADLLAASCFFYFLKNA